jgi:hypothetical protein
MLLILLFAVMLLIMAMRVYLPIGTRPTGKVAKTLSLGLQERALMQRANIYSIAVVLLLMSVTGVLPATGEILVVLIALSILAVPVHYVFTAEGIGVNNVLFRAWQDFESFSVTQRKLVLHGRKGARDLHLHLLANHQKEALPVLRRHLAEAKSPQRAGSHREATAR